MRESSNAKYVQDFHHALAIIKEMTEPVGSIINKTLEINGTKYVISAIMTKDGWIPRDFYELNDGSEAASQS